MSKHTKENAAGSEVSAGKDRRAQAVAFTPGPWNINWGDGNVVTKVFADGVIIGTVAGDAARDDKGTFSDPKTRANARLIAAAPELLAALQDILHVLSPHMHPGDPLRAYAETERKARAALAKATGGGA